MKVWVGFIWFCVHDQQWALANTVLILYVCGLSVTHEGLCFMDLVSVISFITVDLCMK
jgi:hypothetical protein